MFDATFRPLETPSLDIKNFIHFPPVLMILNTHLSIVVVVPVHLDGESWLLLTVGKEFHQNF